MSRLACSLFAAAAVALPGYGLAQGAPSQETPVQGTVELPPVEVRASPPSLTAPTAEQARTEVQRIPGGVAVISDSEFRNSPAQTVKDILGWTPGVVVQPRFGDDARISIRGSGLSRNYGNRGVNLLMDGIPLNTSEGLVDLFEVDPSAYRYVEVFRGANAMRYGGNSLGGAVNFVTPTGRDTALFGGRFDVGSFGYVRGQASTGGVSGPWDFFVSGSAQRSDGYRDHSQGNEQRANANIGYQLSPNAETRFYLNVNRIRQSIPGEVSRDTALNSPRSANPVWVQQNQQRNIESARVANKTTVRLGPTTVEFGLFGLHRHVDHPIYQYLDYTVMDYGAFGRVVDDRTIGGFRNRLIAGVNVHNGRIDYEQYVNLDGARKGALTFSTLDQSQNYTTYVENSFYFLPRVALVAGVQFLHAVRDREDRFLTDGDQSGRRSYDLASPKIGLLWEIDPDWQAFANVSRSAEVPTFDANSFATPASSNLNAQTATTYEIGTRGRRSDYRWDLALYRAEIKNELQCLTTSPFSPCSVVNADRTVHQGIEAGGGVAILRDSFTPNDRVWFNVSYTYNDFTFDGDARYGNNRLPGVPQHQLRTELLYTQQNGLSLGPNVEWVPTAYFADNANSVRANAYALLNFRVSYDRGTGLSGYVEARNLTDTRYISSVAIAGNATAASEIFNPGTGRAIYGGLSYRF